MSKLTIDQRRRGLVNVQRLRTELQSVMDSKKIERGVGKCDLNSRISFRKHK
ncbi:hypothetical protein PE36_12817 [Moritella sp. PE36]|uniref:hypothetical protein n=1 Tax=Moritella sp. PE36 TaxID=58051 RepID=UPI0001568B98|nr:hypothetical protein [Moritella sp. PE36]EDM65028.1 hypothetical protein PE36_12817 [Moritella sp. PE36]